MAWRALLFLMTSAAGGGVATGYQHFKLDCLLSIQKRGIAVTKSRDARVSGRVINCHLKHGSLHGGGTADHNQVTRSAVATAANFANQSRYSPVTKILWELLKPARTFAPAKPPERPPRGFHRLGEGLALAWGLLRFTALRCTRLPEWWLPVKPAFSCYGFLQFCCIRLHKP